MRDKENSCVISVISSCLLLRRSSPLFLAKIVSHTLKIRSLEWSISEARPIHLHWDMELWCSSWLPAACWVVLNSVRLHDVMESWLSFGKCVCACVWLCVRVSYEVEFLSVWESVSCRVCVCIFTQIYLCGDILSSPHFEVELRNSIRVTVELGSCLG